MIIHTAAFKTKHDAGSAELQQFLAHADQLQHIPGVLQFAILPQVSNKSDFQYALYMEFYDQLAYDLYNNHPSHCTFVAEHWLTNVVDFIELDYQKNETR